jgi:hypothetical protein
MHLEGAETMLGSKEEAKMKLWKHNVPTIAQTSVGVMNREDRRQSVPRRPAGLTITVEKIDRVLAEVQAEIEVLRRERTNLGLVRGELVGMEAKWSGSSPCNTSLK